MVCKIDYCLFRLLLYSICTVYVWHLYARVLHSVISFALLPITSTFFVLYLLGVLLIILTVLYLAWVLLRNITAVPGRGIPDNYNCSVTCRGTHENYNCWMAGALLIIIYCSVTDRDTPKN